METLVAILVVVFALLGAPLFAVFGGAAVLLFGSLEDTSLTGAANDVFSEKFADSPLLVTIPLFTFAGYLMAESGTPRRLVELSRAWLGWLPGGLALVCLAASAFFTTFTGGSGITIVAIGGLLLPALIEDAYPERFALGLVTTGGSLGLLFPPSLPIILYGVVAGILIEKLFVAALLPGMLTMAAIGGYSVLAGRRLRWKRTAFDLRAALRTLNRTKWEVALPVGLLAGMYSGFLRIHEAAAFTAAYVLVIEVFVYRDVSLRRDLPRIARESMTLVGAILIIVATATGFTAYLIQAQVPLRLLDIIRGMVGTLSAHLPFSESVWFLLLLNGFLIGVGMLMDIFSAIVVVVPLIAPLATAFEIDPYHLGVIFLLNLEIGYLTPPVGLNLFISSFRFRQPVTLLYKAVLPFIGLLVTALALTTYVPWLSVAPSRLVGPDTLPDGSPTNDLDRPDALDVPANGLPTLDDLTDELDLDGTENSDRAEEPARDRTSEDAPLDLDDLEDELLE